MVYAAFANGLGANPAVFYLLADRLAHRIELTADGYTVYLTAVADALTGHVDNAMLVKFTRRCA